MFDCLDKCSLFCGGPVAPVPDPGNEAKLPLKEHGKDDTAGKGTLLDPVDPMDVKNYLTVHLTRPIGILFEENHDDQYGGAFVADINEGCNAAADGSICSGYQLIAVGTKRVSGMDFEVMKLIFDSVETETKLTFFRGPAESLYGPSGVSVEWLDEFVAERGRENESEASPDVGHAQAHHNVLDDVALAAAALRDVVDETFFTACQTFLDAKSNVEREDAATKAEETSVAVEDEVVAAEAVECDAEDTTEDLVNDDEGDIDEEIERVFQVDNEADALATVEDNADSGEDGACDAIREAETPMLNNAVKASKDWLDKYLANPENQIVSNREVDAVDMVDEPTADLKARCKKAVEVKEAALAAVVESDNSYGTKGILTESCYSPKGVDEMNGFVDLHESYPVSIEEFNDDESAVSSIWSESDDLGELEEVPMKQVSALAALGAASTLIANQG